MSSQRHGMVLDELRAEIELTTTTEYRHLADPLDLADEPTEPMFQTDDVPTDGEVEEPEPEPTNEIEKPKPSQKRPRTKAQKEAFAKAQHALALKRRNRRRRKPSNPRLAEGVHHNPRSPRGSCMSFPLRSAPEKKYVLATRSR